MLAQRWDQEQDREWVRARARCNDGTGRLVALFFSENVEDIARAKGICARCPVRQACLEGALARREPYGVWGGQLFEKGRVLPYKRPRGRPRKDARPLSA